MKAIQPRLELTIEEYQTIVEFLSKKFAFDEMILKQAAVSSTDKAMLQEKLQEADLIYTKLAKQPGYISKSTALLLTGFLMEAQNHYKGFIGILQAMGDPNTQEIESELQKAEAIHEKVNEFLIDCIEE